MNMQDKEMRAQLRERYSVEKVYVDGKLFDPVIIATMALDDIPAALDYIEQTEARLVRAEADYEKARNHATNLTARAEALERFIKRWTAMELSKQTGASMHHCVKAIEYCKDKNSVTPVGYLKAVSFALNTRGMSFDDRVKYFSKPCQEGGGEK